MHTSWCSSPSHLPFRAVQELSNPLARPCAGACTLGASWRVRVGRPPPLTAQPKTPHIRTLADFATSSSGGRGVCGGRSSGRMKTQDLIDQTSQVHYSMFRSARLSEVTPGAVETQESIMTKIEQEKVFLLLLSFPSHHRTFNSRSSQRWRAK